MVKKSTKRAAKRTTTKKPAKKTTTHKTARKEKLYIVNSKGVIRARVV